MKKIFLSFILLLTLEANTVFADNHTNISLPSIYIQPGTIYYPLVRVWEKFSYNFYFGNQAKLSFNRSALKQRVAELQIVTEDQLLGEVQKSTERVSYFVGVVADLLIGEYRHGDKEQAIRVKSEVASEFVAYQYLLPQMRDRFPANSSYWMLVSHSLNSIESNLKLIENEIR